MTSRTSKIIASCLPRRFNAVAAGPCQAVILRFAKNKGDVLEHFHEQCIVWLGELGGPPPRPGSRTTRLAGTARYTEPGTALEHGFSRPILMNACILSRPGFGHRRIRAAWGRMADVKAGIGCVD